MPVNNCRQYYCASSSALPRFWCCQVCKGMDVFRPSRSCRQPCREHLDCSMLPVGPAHRYAGRKCALLQLMRCFFLMRSEAWQCVARRPG